MLALAHPLQHTPTDCLRQASSATRPSRLVSRKSHPAIAPSSHPSSSHTSTVPVASRSSALEGPSPPRRTVPHSTPSSQHTRPSSPRVRDDPQTHGHEVSHHPPEAASSGLDIHSYDPQLLLRLLASLLTQIATANDHLTCRDPYASSLTHPHPSASAGGPHSPIWSTLTSASRHALSTTSSLTFHARNIPTISLESYLLRILKYCPASNEVFLSLLVYFDRMSKLAKETSGRLFVIDSFNIHRLVIAGVTVASKFFSDVFYTNSRYAKVGGLPQAELNQLELQFLLLNDFRLMISAEEMQRYAEQLVHFSAITNQDIALPAPQLPPPILPSELSPTGPTQFMVAMDAHVDNTHHDNTHNQTPHVQPREWRRSISSHSITSTSDAASETETDVDGSTDDEPTIRPAHSSASSETTSLHSTNDDSDSFYADEEDRLREGRDNDRMRRPTEEGTPGRDFRMMSP